VPVDLRPVLVPAHTAVLVIECQVGVLGDDSPVADLARSVREGTLVPTLARFLADARAAGARVYHCTVEPGAHGSLANTPLGARTRGQVSRSEAKPSEDQQQVSRSEAKPSEDRQLAGVAGAILPELGPDPRDVVAPRNHGLTIFHETGLEAQLRGAGIRTVVLTGVSVNIAVTGAAIEAVNRGFTVVIPSDCVAGFPPDFASDALRYSLRNLAYLSTSRAITEIWSS
jgi:nicotinamidase-related amidase